MSAAVFLVSPWLASERVGHPPGEDRRLVRRRRRHGQDRAVARVERDDRAAARVPLLVRLRETDAVLKRLLCGPLELEVDRQTERVPDLRQNLRRDRAERAPERVDVDLILARDTAQVAVVGRLDAALPDLVSARVALAEHVQLPPGDLAHIPEQLRGERAVRVVPYGAASHRDARELGRVLEQVGHERAGRVDAHRHRCQVVAALHARLDAQHDPAHRNLRHQREVVQLGAPGGVPLREVGRPQLYRLGRRVRDDRRSGAVEDQAPRCLHTHRPERVGLCLRDVRRPREHLQRPQSQEERREDDQQSGAEDRDAAREARDGSDGLLALPAGRGPARARTRVLGGRASQAAAPRWRDRCDRAGGAAAARARRPVRRAAG